MTSTRDPILLLEPSNLLEPLDFAKRNGDPLAPREQVDTSSKRFMRPSRSIPAPAERESRWRLRTALIAVGALGCFAAGAALPQLPELAFSDLGSSQHRRSEEHTSELQSLRHLVCR